VRRDAFSIGVVTALILASSWGRAGAQVHTNESSRGVRVLEAEEGDPDVKPSPAPSVLPSPKPAAVVQPLPAPTPMPALKFCDRPFETPDLKLSDGTGFDEALASRLRGGKRVVIDLDQPYKNDAAGPPALQPWLQSVKAGGGAVTVKEYCEAARGSLGEWIANLFGVKPHQDAPYRAARTYNVVLHADALDKVITQVEFAPKSSRTL
jgi:hypothetical protein